MDVELNTHGNDSINTDVGRRALDATGSSAGHTGSSAGAEEADARRHRGNGGEFTSILVLTL